MGRPLTGKKHVGIRRDTRPNGDVYVYERVTGYDAKTQKTKTISTRLLGKILAGTTEMIPTRPKKSRSEVVEPPVEAVRTHVGLQTILEWAGKESGIDEDLKTCFEIGNAQKLSSIARYWVATDGDTHASHGDVANDESVALRVPHHAGCVRQAFCVCRT